MMAEHWARLRAALRDYADNHIPPGCCRAVVTFEHDGGDCKFTVSLPSAAAAAEVPTAPAPARGPPPAEPQLTEREREVLQVFAEADAGAILPWDEVARRAGAAPNNHFRDLLARLVRVGALRNARGEGYFLPRNA